ncbi:MAG TPA: glycosyltransferase [Bacillota bacterium]|nr:glycosyltransferase [Bacillota bacterium]
MPELLTIIYLVYSFIAFYLLFLFLLIYVQNRKSFYSIPEITKNYSLSIVIPCYNEGEDIGGTIEAVLNSDYKGLKKIIVVDDCSTDNSYEIIKGYAKKYEKVMALKTPKNTGKASGSKNYGAKFVDTDLIGFVDADSYPKKDAIRNMIGFFDDKKMASVTSSILVKKGKTFIEKLQSIEYRIIAFTRKLLGFIGAIYVTPGPLAIYRKSAFDDVGRFDEANLTEDIEITWHFLFKGYKIEMSVPSKTHTVAPSRFKMWFAQRIRWNIGGIQTITKYKKTFAKKGILGSFVLPFFIVSWILGLLGIGILVYRGIRLFIVHFLITKYSIGAQTAILTLREINLTPNILIFFGTSILLLSLTFTLLALSSIKEKEFKRLNLLNILIYSFVYLLAYPFILITSIFKYLKKERSW